MKKKVLFISSKSSVFHIPLWKAFEAHGLEVHFVDYRGNPVLEVGNPIHRAIGRLPGGVKDFLNRKANQTIDRNILEAARRVRPNYIFASKAKYIDTAVLDELRGIAPTINWYVDMMSNWGTIQKVVSHYDYLFNYDRYVIDLLKEKGHNNVYHLPWCGYLEKDAQWPDKKEYKHNLVFIGSYHPEIFPREAELGGLKDLGLKVWGRRWENSSLKDCHQGILPPIAEKIQEVYADSKIALYFDSLYDMPGTGITLRPFEITAAGTMMLGQVFRAELPELFVPGKELVTFENLDDLRKKAEYYLAHEEERRAVAKAGFERTRNTHTYYDRVRRVFEIVDGTYPRIQ